MEVKSNEFFDRRDNEVLMRVLSDPRVRKITRELFDVAWKTESHAVGVLFKAFLQRDLQGEKQ